ncbi:MAG: FAD-binding protein [Chloroflexota bacterium]|nr:FAD-binding protein [Chloroflexota bacterium]
MTTVDLPNQAAFEVLDTQATLQALQDIVGDRVSATDADRSHHSRDQSSHSAGLPDFVVWPKSTAEASAVLRYANEVRLPVTAWGAGTSLEGNPIPIRGGLVLSFQRMNQILEIYHTDFQVRVQPGILYKDMNDILGREGLFFAPDPGANASIGGMIANNAAGTRTVKYGATRDNVLTLEVVLADGRVVRTGSRSVKQSSGYDLTHLFVGSEGTLGVVTEATLRLAPLPEYLSAVVAAFPDVPTAAAVVYTVMASGVEPAALEILDASAMQILNGAEGFDFVDAPHLLMEFHGTSEAALGEELELVEEICRDFDSLDYRAGVGRDARDHLWRARHRLFESMRRTFPGDSYLITDVAVPISNYPKLAATAAESIAERDAKGSIIGHAGDGNLHTTIFFSPDDVVARRRAAEVNDLLVARALELEGTSTGEHGIGIGKQKYMLMEHGEIALDLMRQLKATLDPNGILNPGKILAL